MTYEFDTLRLAWSNFLGQWPYASFGTFTFRDKDTSVRYPHVALDRVERYFSARNNGIYGIRRAFLASEEHKMGGYHVHALLETVLRSPQIVRSLAQDYESRYGFCRIVTPHSSLAVRLYCSKYVSKELSDWRFFGDFSEKSKNIP